MHCCFYRALNISIEIQVSWAAEILVRYQNHHSYYQITPSSFDRSEEPPYGENPDLNLPNVWQAALDSGIKLYGIESDEVPLVQFQMQLKGGATLEDAEKGGVANILADLMTKGSQSKTAAEFEAAVESLGASLNVSARKESVVITGNSLAKNYEELMKLVQEILL